MNSSTQPNSPAWVLFSWLSFAISTGFTLIGTYYMDVDLWVKGYLWMGLLFSVGSTFTLSKTIRDSFEHQRQARRGE